MLQELRIRNFAIIDSLELEFKPGLVILTGETGAGKSIIMGALDMLLGHRVDMSTLRSGSDFASVEAVFLIPEVIQDQINTILAAEELQEEGLYLTLTRELRRDKRNVARVNGHRTNVSILVALGELLVDIHGQSEHLSLMRVDQHLGLLDRFVNAPDLLDSYQEAYRELSQTRDVLERLRTSDKEAAQRQDLLQFQVQEIESASLDPDEEDELIEYRNRLSNAEKLASLSREALAMLDEAPPDQPTAVDLLGQALEAVEKLRSIDQGLDDLGEQVEGVFQGLTDISRELRLYLESLEFDPGELEKAADRVELIRNLKKKYGETIRDVLEYQEQARSELAEITDRGQKIEEYEAREKKLLEILAKRGRLLSESRQAGAEDLTKKLEAQLGELKMAGACFKVDFSYQEDSAGVPIGDRFIHFYQDGLERVEFLIETNPGEGLKPLARVASGGETARLMLAIKNVLAEADQVSTLVFDEIDQGIGGRIGVIVGQKLHRLARNHQVFCITHLPQLAGFGQQHFQVSKELEAGRSIIQVEEISGEERVHELANMLGGVSEPTLNSARELLETVAEIRNL